jgi:lantibiotic modifying enzyme
VIADRDRFLVAAERIGCRLCRDAVWAEGRCTWLGWAMEPRAGQWLTAFRALGTSLYDGAAGIGLFLARLARAVDDGIIRATAAAALGQALTGAEGSAAAGEYGFYAGLSGIAWACIEAGRALRHEGLAARGKAAMLAAARIPPSRLRVDLINGSAGLILVLLRAAAVFDDREAEAVTAAATEHGEHLLALARRDEGGWSWDTLSMPEQPHLLGLAHGTSGIAYALAALALATGRDDFRHGARMALRFERRHFRPAAGNWPDLRSFVQPAAGGEPPCTVAWCHGAPGIGMARLALHRLLPDEAEILDEAEIAIRTTAATFAAGGSQGLGNFSLCHGDGGNADLLIMAADQLQRPQLRQQAEAVGMRGLQLYEDQAMPWPCGVLGAGETAGLMLGLAGIGHFYLRLCDSERNPSVLLP